MNIVIIVMLLTCFFLSIHSSIVHSSSETCCAACPPGKDGVNGRDGTPGRDGRPGRDGTPGVGICLGRAEQDEKMKKQDKIIAEQSEQIAQLRKAIDRLTNFVNQTVTVNQRTSFPSGARICSPGSYLAFGFCLPKSPSPYINHTSCSSGFKLYRGVCYRWPSPRCQTQDLVTADSTCKTLEGRLCTVTELDHLSGSGCHFDYAGSWALLALQYSENWLAHGICFRHDSSYAHSNSLTRPAAGDVMTIAWCTAVTSLGADARSNIKAGVMCCKT
ncbi:uncharacterized protein LOC134197486 [Corticium candelabrum]|uniref:uncharacterized protein LOC134197486 n=1 Tax=Corticium candelabrum TaxID=121492 RepID=UPI002E265111|nr:uncharacterized protein LOC134197486 [Corticium candelabrum]